MKNAVIYARTATQEQSKNDSIEHQKEECLKFAEQNVYQVKNIFADVGYPANKLDRPELQKLMEYCRNKNNNIEVVIVITFDRLTRNFIIYKNIIKPFLKEANIKLLSIR